MSENQSNEQKSKRGLKDLRHRKADLRRKTRVFIILLLVAGSIGALVWYVASRPRVPEAEIVSRTGIHWHPQLSIMIKGVRQEISANIGIGFEYKNSKWWDPMMSMTNIHTHDGSGTLHWEVMAGPVTKEHVTLKAFFTGVWGKQFNANCIFDFCNGLEGQVKMFVNGKENTEFENYLIKDKDKIEIRYE